MKFKIEWNKKTRIILICAVAVLVIAAATVCIFCFRPKGFKKEKAYKATLDEFYGVIADPKNARQLYDGLSSVREAALEFGDEAADKIGYVFKDTNKDGKEELFIGCFDSSGSAAKNEIYAAFSHDGESLTPLFEKQKQNTFALTDTGSFYFYGTDGEKYYILGEYVLDGDGALVCKEFYFTYPKNGDGNNFAYYRNTTGKWDPAQSEEIDLTPEAFEELRQKLAKRTVPLDAVKFSQMGKK